MPSSTWHIYLNGQPVQSRREGWEHLILNPDRAARFRVLAKLCVEPDPLDLTATVREATNQLAKLLPGEALLVHPPVGRRWPRRYREARLMTAALKMGIAARFVHRFDGSVLAYLNGPPPGVHLPPSQGWPVFRVLTRSEALVLEAIPNHSILHPTPAPERLKVPYLGLVEMLEAAIPGSALLYPYVNGAKSAQAVRIALLARERGHAVAFAQLDPGHVVLTLTGGGK